MAWYRYSHFAGQNSEAQASPTSHWGGSEVPLLRTSPLVGAGLGSCLPINFAPFPKAFIMNGFLFLSCLLLTGGFCTFFKIFLQLYGERGIYSPSCHFSAAQIFLHIILAPASLAKLRAADHAGSHRRSKAFSDTAPHASRKGVPPLYQELPALRRSPLVISWQSTSGESTENWVLSRKQTKWNQLQQEVFVSSCVGHESWKTFNTSPPHLCSDHSEELVPQSGHLPGFLWVTAIPSCSTLDHKSMA